jgi:RNA polymerase sigma-70 factor (ECF subfamily)
VSDEERFTAIFETYFRRVDAYVRRRVPLSVAPDIVAETFLAAWRQLDTLNDQPLPWLYKAAALEIAHRRRSIQRDERLWQRAAAAPRPLIEADPAELVAGRDQWAAAFALLSEADREVLRLVAWEDLEPAEAAKTLGCTVIAFRVRLHRARRRLTALAAKRSAHDLSETPAFPHERPAYDVDGLCN